MSWAQAEFHDLELGDARRTQRLIKLVGGRSVGPADREHPAGLRGLVGAAAIKGFRQGGGTQAQAGSDN